MSEKQRTQYGSGNPGSFRDSRGSRSSGFIAEGHEQKTSGKIKAAEEKTQLVLWNFGGDNAPCVFH